MILTNRILAFGFALLIAAIAPADDRPNIVWIVADDMSADMGCYGDDYAYTPNLDRLAAQGVRYTHAFAVNGQCAPSRSALVTGMFPTSIGTHNMRSQGLPPAHVKLVGEYLRAAGYFCTNNGKSDYNLGNGANNRSGILPVPIGAWDTNSARTDWRDRPDDRPFFSVFNIAHTHESRLHMPPEAFERVVEKVPAEHRHDPAESELPSYYPDNPVFRSDWAKYHDTVSAMDIEAQAILDRLEEDGLVENTVVFFFGDHGRPLPRAKRWLYDSGLHVPLIIRWPNHLKPGSASDDMISFVDFAPTVLSIAGVPIPDHMEGTAFLGDSAAPMPQYVYGQRDRVDQLTDRCRSVRGEQFLYIKNDFPDIPYSYELPYMDRMPGMQEWRRLHAAGELSGAPALFFAPARPAEELYDTHTDPDNVVNLAGLAERAETLRQMQTALNDWIAATGDLGQREEDELDEEWRPDGKWSTTATPGVAREGETLTITCATPGSSIEYTTDSRSRAVWTLYTGPFTPPEADVLRVRAGRLGFKDSEEVSYALD